MNCTAPPPGPPPAPHHGGGFGCDPQGGERGVCVNNAGCTSHCVDSRCAICRPPSPLAPSSPLCSALLLLLPLLCSASLPSHLPVRDLKPPNGQRGTGCSSYLETDIAPQLLAKATSRPPPAAPAAATLRAASNACPTTTAGEAKRGAAFPCASAAILPKTDAFGVWCCSLSGKCEVGTGECSCDPWASP